MSARRSPRSASIRPSPHRAGGGDGWADACLTELHRLGCAQAAIIGRVLPKSEAEAPIRLVV